MNEVRITHDSNYTLEDPPFLTVFCFRLLGDGMLEALPAENARLSLIRSVYDALVLEDLTVYPGPSCGGWPSVYAGGVSVPLHGGCRLPAEKRVELLELRLSDLLRAVCARMQEWGYGPTSGFLRCDGVVQMYGKWLGATGTLCFE